MSVFSFRAVFLGDAGIDDRGLLVSVEGRLVAVLAKLTVESHELARGRWYIEAAFGRWYGRPTEPFYDLSSALLHIAERLGHSGDSTKAEVSKAQREYDGA